MKACLLLSALLLAAAPCPPAFAVLTYTVELSPAGWYQGPGGVHTYDRFNASWSYLSNGEAVELLTGCTPPHGTDPRIRQNIVNNSFEDIWTDWHVQITNGKNLRGVSVYKVGEGTAWVIETYTDKVGFFAHVISAGQSSPMAVNALETLYVEFTYDVDVASQPVTVTQYPTTWWPVPEPASMMALLMGIGGLCAGWKLRK